MNSALLDRLATDKRVQKTLRDFEAQVNQVPALREMATIFSQKIGEADVLLASIEKDNTAYRLEKDRVAGETFTLGARLGRCLSALARKKKDEVLEAAAVKSVSAMKAGKPAEVIVRLKNLRDALTANARELENYQVAATEIAEFTDKVAEFEAKVTGPREMRDERVVDNQQFADLVSELSEILRIDLNDIILGVADKFPELNAAFLQSSKIVRTVTATRELAKKAAPKEVKMPSKPLVTENKWPVDFKNGTSELSANGVASNGAK